MTIMSAVVIRSLFDMNVNLQ